MSRRNSHGRTRYTVIPVISCFFAMFLAGWFNKQQGNFHGFNVIDPRMLLLVFQNCQVPLSIVFSTGVDHQAFAVRQMSFDHSLWKNSVNHHREKTDLYSYIVIVVSSKFGKYFLKQTCNKVRSWDSMGPQTLWNKYFYRNLTTSTMGWTKDQLQHSWCQGPEIAPPAAAKVDSFAWDGMELLDGGSVRECRDTTFFFLPFWSFWKDNLDKSLFGSAKFTRSSLQTHFKFWIWAFTSTFWVHIHSSSGDPLEKSGRTVYGTLIQGNTGDYTIFLDKSTGARLGIDVDHKDSRPGASRIVFTGWSYCNAGLAQFGLIISAPDNDICLISMATLGMTHQPKGNPWPWPSIVNQRWALVDPRWSKMDYTRAVSACFSILGCPGWRDLAYRSDQPRIGPGTEMGAVVGVQDPCLCWTMFKMNSQGHTWLVTARIQVTILWLSAEAPWL